MKDYLANTDYCEKKNIGTDRALKYLFHEMGYKSREITEDARKGYYKALSQLTCSSRAVFRLRAEALLTYDRIAAICRTMNAISPKDCAAPLPTTVSGVRRAFMKAVNLMCSPDYWRYIVDNSGSVEDEKITFQMVKTVSNDRMFGLPKSIQDALRRNGINSLDDERLKDKKRKFSGLGPKKMSEIYSYMGMQ